MKYFEEGTINNIDIIINYYKGNNNVKFDFYTGLKKEYYEKTHALKGIPDTELTRIKDIESTVNKELEFIKNEMKQ